MFKPKIGDIVKIQDRIMWDREVYGMIIKINKDAVNNGTVNIELLDGQRLISHMPISLLQLISSVDKSKGAW